jgi:hypothetical protein
MCARNQAELIQAKVDAAAAVATAEKASAVASAQRALALAAQQRTPAPEAAPPSSSPLVSEADAPAAAVTMLQVETLDVGELDATLATPPVADTVRGE